MSPSQPGSGPSKKERKVPPNYKVRSSVSKTNVFKQHFIDEIFEEITDCFLNILSFLSFSFSCNHFHCNQLWWQWQDWAESLELFQNYGLVFGFTNFETKILFSRFEDVVPGELEFLHDVNFKFMSADVVAVLYLEFRFG